MLSKQIRTGVVALLCMMMMGGMAAHAAVSGSITAVGASALQPLVEQAANQYMAKNPQARILVQGGGSGTGLTQVAAGNVDIGMSDIYAEERPGIDPALLVDHKVCVIGFAAVVNKSVTVKNLTQDQLINIFTGKYTNWNQVGGPNIPIVLINRAASSGTRATFRKYALNGAQEATGLALTQDSSGAVKQTIADTRGAIGYLALSYVDDSINALSINGAAPTKENITSGKYIVWSYEHMYTKGAPTGLTKAFLDYMVGPEVQNTLVGQMGYIPISEMKVSR